MKARDWAALDEAQTGAEAKSPLQALARDYQAAYLRRLADENVDPLVVHLRFPGEHRKRIRSTNLLERTFVEVRRRTKVIGRFPGETSALPYLGCAQTRKPSWPASR